MNSLDFIKQAKSGKINIIENTKNTISKIKKINNEYNYFINIDQEYSLSEAKRISKQKPGKLFGLPISVKDCITVKDMESKAGSKILEGYHPVKDAAVISKIKDEGGVVIGKTSQDVFGFGSFNTNVGLGCKTPKNPLDKTRATGGSSGGSAGITKKADFAHISIAESTGGSIACPACYCGVYGMTPTYGLVSRYGLMDYANSLDKIGIMSKDIEEAALMLEIIAGHDENDATCVKKKPEKYSKQKFKNFRIGVLTDSFNQISKDVKNNLIKVVKGFKHDHVKMPLTMKYALQTYYLISMSEASTNLAKYCGMRYGKHDELKGNYNEYFSSTRSKYFSKEAKRRIVLGTFARMSGYRDAYYLKALKVRTKIINEYKSLFEKYDLLISPTMPDIAPKFSEIEKLTPLQNYMMDILTVGPNLAGLPHLNIPTGISQKMPTGLMAITQHFNEQKVIDFARMIKKKIETTK